MSKLTRSDVYPLAYPDCWKSKAYKDFPRSVRARWTGEKRGPKKGEWFLSGAVIEAYLAYNDMDTHFHIAELVRVREVRKIEVVEVVS